MKRIPLLYSACLAAALIPSHLLGDQPEETGHPEIILHRPNPGNGYAPTAGSTSKVNPSIVYHGGPVMRGTPNVYVIWYGTWTAAQKGIIKEFLNAVGGSPYFNINTTYADTIGAVSGKVTFAGEFASTYPIISTPLSDQDIENIVAAVASDTTGIYFVLTGSDVTKSGFCTSYCGWHTHALLSAGDIKYSFVGNPTACPLSGASVGSCAAQTAKSPNGDVGVDAMISVIAHELEEAVTDPDLNAWWDNRGYENADKCAWTFGTTQVDSNGAYYNMTLGTSNYLIQRNLIRNSSGNYCVRGVSPDGTLIK